MEQIRDKGKSAEQAAKVQAVVAGLSLVNTVQPVIEPVIHVTDRATGWDSEGNYHG